ncbi:MAG: hypothetical protein AAFY36_12615 [Bacteroidota bacterium]
MYKIVIFILLIACCSCNEERIEPDPGPPSTEYYPLAVGNSWVYQVDSIILVPVTGGTRYDTSRLQARETLVDTLRDQAGQLWYRGLREERIDASQSWSPAQTFAVRVDGQGVYRQEDNLEFLRLAFPLGLNRRWDGHVAFDEFRPIAVGPELLDVYAGWDYRVIAVDEAFTLSTGRSFDETLLVEQAMVDNLIDFRRSFARYAKGVGPIETFVDARHTQCQVCCNGDTGSCLDLDWDTKSEKGYIVSQVLQ